MGESSTARARWELENNVQTDEVESYFRYDPAEQQAIQTQKPWTKDPNYYKHVRISALALLKMAMHAKSGGNLEIMGMLQGKVVGDTFIVVDAFALPVEGTETRVNAQAEAYEYLIDFAETNKRTGRLENMVGWYHSHPGYGCWLSGIDVGTQMTQQQYQEPFIAVVVDPHRTIAAGKVEIGAFRTYPEGYKPPDEGPSEYQTIPMNKIEDFGVHCKQYYSLDITYFKSAVDSHMLDLLWNKYWVNTLSSSPLLGTRDLMAGQVADIAEKLEAAEGQLAHSGRIGRFVAPGDKKGNGNDQQLLKICRDASKLSVEQIKGVSSQVIKDLLFNPAPLLTNGNAPAPMEL
ncbi:hypothetical protein WJX72_001788 [[Myrmecia] bisecta]|uniref:MPN domain-containing protein n=1 Tax=[Myrmecia] bisecta TaxID=41462 RepID=A0AAW1QEB5_9CHLO